MKNDIDYGDRLVSATVGFSNPASPTGMDQITYSVRDTNIRSITVGRVGGPDGWVLTAQITFSGDSPDIIVPLYKIDQFEVQYGD
jgi:hypothetical protein